MAGRWNLSILYDLLGEGGVPVSKSLLLKAGEIGPCRLANIKEKFWLASLLTTASEKRILDHFSALLNSWRKCKPPLTT